MTQRRLLPGIKAIAAIFFVDAAILLSFSIASYLLPVRMFTHVQEALKSIPYFGHLPLENDAWTIFSDVFLGLWAALKGIGIWQMWQWVRALIVIDLLLRVSDFLLLFTIADQHGLKSQLSNPEFVLGSVINLMVLVYLLNPSVKESFESATY